MVCKAVPTNAYHVVCGNCHTPFKYKEIFPYEKALKDIQDSEKREVDDKNKMENQLKQMKQSEDEHVLEQIPIVEIRIDEIQQEIFKLRQKRCILKATLQYTNKYSNEGAYNYYYYYYYF